MSPDEDWELFDDDENNFPTDSRDEPELETEPEPEPEPEPELILTDDDFDDEPEPVPVVIRPRRQVTAPVQVEPEEPPRKGFFETLKGIFFTRKSKSATEYVSKNASKKGLVKKAKSTRLGAWASKKEKEITTGLTTRQRIKRYNAIHEGDYGAPIPAPKTDE